MAAYGQAEPQAPAAGSATLGPAPEDVRKKIERGRTRMEQGAALANECLRFWRGDQYVYRNSENVLVEQPTLYGSPGKDAWRAREVRNMLVDVVAQETSAATQRVPGYEINPSKVDPESVGAARLSQKVADYGYDKWRIRNATTRVVEYAVIADEGFAWPYFDNTIGDSIDGEVSTGDICLHVYGRNQVMWEPGVLFEDSRWHAVESAEPVDQVMAMQGFIGGPLKADSAGDDRSQKDIAASNLVRVTHYLERPSSRNPTGRHQVLANGRQIVKETTYPCVRLNAQGGEEYVDEPVLHKLSYFLDPESERDMGLLRHLLSAQRTINDCTNKQIEWKNHALIPQLLAPVGSIRTQRTDQPGAVIEYIPINGVVPQWQPVPPVPQELSQIKQEAKSDISVIAAQTVIPNQVESGDAITALIEKDANRRQEFIARLAEFHSRLMRHCLYLVQKYYTEPRLLQIRGRFGPETITDFLGAQLLGECDVTVLPGSIEPKTRAKIGEQVMGFADRGWISPQAAMAAINNGTAASLVESYELDVGRANLVIQKIRAFGTISGDVPEPRPFDNLDVHEAVLTDWMKTSDYDDAIPPVQEAANLYYEALQQLKAQKAAQDAAAQDQMAQSLGMANAARPVGPASPPSPPSPTGSSLPAQ